MTIHLCRDYTTQNVTTGNRTYIYAYILAIFMRRILGFTYVGDTNFNINSIGTLLLATGDTTPTVAPTFPAGRKAGINLGSQKEFYVSIPVAVRTVSLLDVGRILVLRSTSNPTFNSGLFAIVGFDVSTNSYIIDYRTLGDKPPVEPADSMNWYLYEKDTNCPTQGVGNTLKTSAQYRGDGNSTTPRVMLQSPHSTNYQVRICNESTVDFAVDNNNGNCPVTSVALGFGGTASGDFTVGGSHTHAPQWADSSSIVYLGGAPGPGDGGGAIGTQFRVTMIGGDDGYGAAIFARRPGNAVQPTSFVCTFGIPFNEPLPLPLNPAARLFTIGSGYMGNDNSFGNRTTNDMGLQAGVIRSIINSNNVSQGMSYAPFGTPVMCAASFWAFITGGGQNTGPQLDSSASDTPFINSTELLPLDLIQGTLSSWNTNSTSVPAFPLAPRLMGTIPYVYEGRANFGDFSPSTDPARSFQHMRRGLFIPWNGPNIIP
jgi:hypothetical protein